MAATTQEVLTHHLHAFGKGDLAGVAAVHSERDAEWARGHSAAVHHAVQGVRQARSVVPDAEAGRRRGHRLHPVEGRDGGQPLRDRDGYLRGEGWEDRHPDLRGEDHTEALRRSQRRRGRPASPAVFVAARPSAAAPSRRGHIKVPSTGRLFGLRTREPRREGMSMKIGIVGAGIIGGTLVRKLRASGHGVRVANSRGPESLSGSAAETRATAVTAAEVAAGVDVLIVSVRFQQLTALKPLISEVASDITVVETSNYLPTSD